MSTEQVMSALQKANRMRSERSRVRKAIEEHRDYVEGRSMVAAVLEEPLPAALGTLPARELLRWVHNMNGPTVTRLLTAVDATEFTLCGKLTARQRCELARLLRGDSETLRLALEDRAIRRWAAGRAAA